MLILSNKTLRLIWRDITASAPYESMANVQNIMLTLWCTLKCLWLLLIWTNDRFTIKEMWWMNFLKKCSQLFLWSAFDAINKASNPADICNIPIEDRIFMNILLSYHLLDRSCLVFKFFSTINGTLCINILVIVYYFRVCISVAKQLHFDVKFMFSDSNIFLNSHVLPALYKLTSSFNGT